MQGQFFTRNLPPLERIAQPMKRDAEMTPIPPTTGPVVLTPAAERMRLHRERRRQGLRCLTIQLRETEVDALIHKGMLNSEMRNDVNAVLEALYEHLERTLDARQ
jgi:hypothetical protein